MSKWQQATATPLRTHKEGGYVFMSVIAIEWPDGSMTGGIDVCAYSYPQAKRMFWESWRERIGSQKIWLNFKQSSG